MSYIFVEFIPRDGNNHVDIEITYAEFVSAESYAHYSMYEDPIKKQHRYECHDEKFAALCVSILDTSTMPNISVQKNIGQCTESDMQAAIDQFIQEKFKKYQKENEKLIKQYIKEYGTNIFLTFKKVNVPREIIKEIVHYTAAANIKNPTIDQTKESDNSETETITTSYSCRMM